jgi:L-2-hydroxyglutarate oxidase LhgO
MNICNPYLKGLMPKVESTDVGYKIETQVLTPAMLVAWNDFGLKMGAYEVSITKQDNTVTTNISLGENHQANKLFNTAKQFADYVAKKQGA